MQNINQLLTNNVAVAFFILLALFVIMTITFVITILKNRKITNNYKALLRGMKDKNLEEILFEHIKKVEKASLRVDDLEIQYRKLEKVSQNCLQNVGIVRFNAFEDTGSDLSFAIAILDDHKDGVIISSIFSRHDSRIYAKPVNNGISNYNLSNEEQEALNIALK